MASALERAKRAKLPPVQATQRKQIDVSSENEPSKRKDNKVDGQRLPEIQRAMKSQKMARKIKMVPRGANERADTVTAIQLIKGLDAEAEKRGSMDKNGGVMSHMDFDDGDDVSESEVSPCFQPQHDLQIQHGKQQMENSGKWVTSEQQNGRWGVQTKKGVEVGCSDVRRKDALPAHVTVLGSKGELWSYGQGPPGECPWHLQFQQMAFEGTLGGEECDKIGVERAKEVYNWCGHYHCAETDASHDVQSNASDTAKTGSRQDEVKRLRIKSKLLKTAAPEVFDETEQITTAPTRVTLATSSSDQNFEVRETINSQLLQDRLLLKGCNRVSDVSDPAYDSGTGLPGPYEVVQQPQASKGGSKNDLYSKFRSAVGGSVTKLFGIKETEEDTGDRDEDEDGEESRIAPPLFTRPTMKDVQAMRAGRASSANRPSERSRATTRDIDIMDAKEEGSYNFPTSPVTPWANEPAKKEPKDPVARLRPARIPVSPTRILRHTKSDQSMKTTTSKSTIAPPIPPMSQRVFRTETTMPPELHRTRVTKCITPKMPSAPEEEGWNDAVRWAKRNLEETYAREEAERKAEAKKASLDPREKDAAERRAKIKAGKRLIQRCSGFGWAPIKPYYEMTSDEFEAVGLAVEAEELATLEKKAGYALKTLFKFVGPKQATEDAAKRRSTQQKERQEFAEQELPPPPVPSKSAHRQRSSVGESVADNVAANKADRAETASATQTLTVDATRDTNGVENASENVGGPALTPPTIKEHVWRQCEAVPSLWIDDNESSAPSICEHRRLTYCTLFGHSPEVSLEISPVGLGISSVDALVNTKSASATSRLTIHNDNETTPSEPDVADPDDKSVYSQDIDGIPSPADEPTLPARPRSQKLEHLTRRLLVPTRSSSFLRTINEASQQRAARLDVAMGHPALRPGAQTQIPTTTLEVLPAPCLVHDTCVLSAAPSPSFSIGSTTDPSRQQRHFNPIQKAHEIETRTAHNIASSPQQHSNDGAARGDDGIAFLHSPEFRVVFDEVDDWFNQDDASDNGINRTTHAESDIYEAHPIDEDGHVMRFSADGTGVISESERASWMDIERRTPVQRGSKTWSALLQRGLDEVTAECDVVVEQLVADSRSKPTIAIDIDDVIRQWEQSTPKKGAEQQTPSSSIADCAMVQDLRHEVGIPPLKERKSQESLEHPNHPYAFQTENLMCYGLHNPPPANTPTKIPPQQCRECKSTCCRFAQLLLQAGASATDVMDEHMQIRARGRIDILRSNYPNGIEEYETFLTCAECSKTVCPRCATVCENLMCRQVHCGDCGEDGCGLHD